MARELKYISKEFRIIKENSKFGIADFNGMIIVEPVFDYIRIEELYVILRLEGYGEAIYPTSKLREL